jgi:hypothetical protein
MKIRSLLLGSVAAAGLATTGFAADLGVVTSLDICDELGLSGLTISSDENCLVITGGVTVEYSIGDYSAIATAYQTFARTGGTVTYDEGDGTTNATLDIDAWLKFVATADSDFGPATATIKLLSDDNNGVDDDPDTMDTDEWDVQVDEAWVGIGDTTMLMAGKKSSIFNAGDDGPLNKLGLFNSSNVDAGVGFATAGAVTGGNVIQVVHNLGNGLSLGGGIENLQTSAAAVLTGVGVIAYAGDGITAHVSGAVDQASAWKLHAGFTGAWDPVKVVGAIAADDTGWWNALGSVSATFDMFTLAASAEATSASEWGVGGSAEATVSEGVSVYLAGRYFSGTVIPADNYQVEAGVSAAVTETITLTAAVGAVDSTAAGTPQIFYGKGGLAWAPGGGFTSSVEGYVNSESAYKATFKAAKTIK